MTVDSLSVHQASDSRSSDSSPSDSDSSSSDSDSSTSTTTTSTDSTNDTDQSDSESSGLSSSSSSSSSSSTSSSSSSDDDDTSSDSDSEIGGGGGEADDEGGDGDSESGSDGEQWDGDDVHMDPLLSAENFASHHRPSLASRVRAAYSNLYEKRYTLPHRKNRQRGPAYLPYVLEVLKTKDPAKFRQELRVTPYTYDQLVARVRDDPIFHNESQNDQISVEHQVAIMLYRFGHSGNAAGLQKVANWSGYGKGTINLVTRRVLTALLRHEFVSEAIRFPTAEEKEKAKAWVEDHSCPAWRNGYLFVDGTLIPLYGRPYWYGESYFNRICNYSLNIQVGLQKCLTWIKMLTRIPLSDHISS